MRIHSALRSSVDLQHPHMSHRIEGKNMFVEWAHMRPHQDPAAYYAEPSRWSLSLAKRCIDLLFSVAALLLFWPLLLVTALLVLYDSPGPVIFRQKRLGRHGVLFTVFKFRTYGHSRPGGRALREQAGGSAGDKNREISAQV